MSDETPTVVLVHGAFADASSWNGVVELLQAKGVKVTAPANPLRGIAIDSAYIAGVLDEMPGPILAVGHSYGGAVLTNAATNAENVVGLVYVAAFAPDEGEVLGEVTAGSKDSVLDTALVPCTTRQATAASRRWSSRSTLPSSTTRSPPTCPPSRPRCWPPRSGPSRRRRSPSRQGRPHGSALPSWAAVASSDTAAGTDVIRSMAERAGATITELEGSHVIMISQPQAVTDVILEALSEVGSQT